MGGWFLRVGLGGEWGGWLSGEGEGGRWGVGEGCFVGGVGYCGLCGGLGLGARPWWRGGGVWEEGVMGWELLWEGGCGRARVLKALLRCSSTSRILLRDHALIDTPLSIVIQYTATVSRLIISGPACMTRMRA